MKKQFSKIIGLVLLAMLISTKAFAAAATITSTEYGYKITGGTSATLVPQDTWVTATAYSVGDRVVKDGYIYNCLIAHTSGTFATDNTNGKWNQFAKATIYLYMALFNPASSTDTASFTSGPTNQSAFNLNLNQESILLTHPQTFGTPFTSLIVTLSSASNIVYLYVYKNNF